MLDFATCMHFSIGIGIGIDTDTDTDMAYEDEECGKILKATGLSKADAPYWRTARFGLDASVRSLRSIFLGG